VARACQFFLIFGFCSKDGQCLPVASYTSILGMRRLFISNKVQDLGSLGSQLTLKYMHLRQLGAVDAFMLSFYCLPFAKGNTISVWLSGIILL